MLFWLLPNLLSFGTNCRGGGCGSVVECGLPKPEMRVRFPSPAPLEMANERGRFYLLPGMGGSALRRKRKLILQWSIVTGLFVSGIVAGLLYLLYQKTAR